MRLFLPVSFSSFHYSWQFCMLNKVNASLFLLLSFSSCRLYNFNTFSLSCLHFIVYLLYLYTFIYLYPFIFFHLCIIVAHSARLAFPWGSSLVPLSFPVMIPVPTAHCMASFANSFTRSESVNLLISSFLLTSYPLRTAYLYNITAICSRLMLSPGPNLPVSEYPVTIPMPLAHSTALVYQTPAWISGNFSVYSTEGSPFIRYRISENCARARGWFGPNVV